MHGGPPTTKMAVTPRAGGSSRDGGYDLGARGIAADAAGGDGSQPSLAAAHNEQPCDDKMRWQFMDNDADGVEYWQNVDEADNDAMNTAFKVFVETGNPETLTLPLTAKTASRRRRKKEAAATSRPERWLGVHN